MKPAMRLFESVSCGVALLALAPSALAARSLDDYRYFRALSIDLAGRMPTRAELTAFEADSFDEGQWIDSHLTGAAYAERIRRVYMDLMRLEVSNAFRFSPSSTRLERQSILGPDGKPLFIYFRSAQRRTRAETDKDFCLTAAETGLTFPPNNGPPTGTAIPISQAALDASTVVVRPWWLYRDYKSTNPQDLYSPATWATKVPGFKPVDALLQNADSTPTTEIRVCKEEAQTSPTGAVLSGGGGSVTCVTGSGYSSSAECGCGVGLERCLPGANAAVDPKAFAFAANAPLGLDQPFDEAQQSQSSWSRLWWSQEFVHFFDDIIASDRDFREVLTSHATFVNGPLSQFYSSLAPSSCCSNGAFYGYLTPEPLFDPAKLPPSLLPHDATSWVRVDERGPRASGLLTMPIFLSKYGTRRARAHVLYNTFLCRDFIAENVKLLPSTEPNLMIRPGCSTCHQTLEPLAAYFTRIAESDWTYLPKEKFPLKNPKCAVAPGKKAPSSCDKYYDPAFTDASAGSLRGAYGSEENAEAGPSALAQVLTESAEFPVCVVRNIASSFLGRTLDVDDDELETSLAADFVSDGYHIKSLVRALVRADAYKRANNLARSAGQGQGDAP